MTYRRGDRWRHCRAKQIIRTKDCPACADRLGLCLKIPPQIWRCIDKPLNSIGIFNQLMHVDDSIPAWGLLTNINVTQFILRSESSYRFQLAVPRCHHRGLGISRTEEISTWNGDFWPQMRTEHAQFSVTAGQRL